MTFSVIVPIDNVERFIHRCIDSILAQTFVDFEVILVDDGSTDRCPEICDEYARLDSRVRVIHKQNGGLVSARNAGIFAAKGDYISYVDGDDWADPRMLQFANERINAYSVPLDMVLFAAKIVYADHMVDMDNKVAEGTYDRQRLEKDIFPNLLSDRRNGFRLGTDIMGHTWNKICRRDLQLKYYVRDERIHMFTDVPMTYECILNCQNIFICNEHLYFYNKTNENSIIAVGKRNYLTKKFIVLIPYLQERLRVYGSMMAQEVNDYPVHLIIQCAMWRLDTEPNFFSAAHKVREGLKESHILDYISTKSLPRNPKLLIILFKLHFVVSAMFLCYLKKPKRVKVNL